eukprot:XP_011419093.1 PREDICTED: uncharacterized protein LOC105322211 [Crassostrea gigas]
MNLLTVACVILSLSFGLEARRYSDQYRPGGPVTPIIEPIPVDPINPGPFPPNPPSTLTCQYGHQIDQQGRCTNFNSYQQCPAGFFCNFGPADEPGPCCLRNNPCTSGAPLQLGGDAVNCGNGRCPNGYRCSTGSSYAVCCPDTYPGPSHPVDPVGPCPNVFCPAVSIPPECRKETFIYNNGRKCRGCPQNICPVDNGPPPGNGGYVA